MVFDSCGESVKSQTQSAKSSSGSFIFASTFICRALQDGRDKSRRCERPLREHRRKNRQEHRAAAEASNGERPAVDVEMFHVKYNY